VEVTPANETVLVTATRVRFEANLKSLGVGGGPRRVALALCREILNNSDNS